MIDFRLYLITDRHQTGGRPLVEVVHAALDGGVKAVQLREKDLGGRELCRLAEELRCLTDRYAAGLYINERVDVALSTGADGVHLGASGIPVAAARRIAGQKLQIGYSSHGLEDASRAEADGADFVTFGPVYHTPSKAAYGQPLGLLPLKAAAERLSIPLFALGGVKKTNITEVMAAGASGIALISAILSAAEPAQEAALMLEMIEGHVTDSR